MPYSLSSAPSAFQKILSSILAGIEGSINIINDIIVQGKDLEEHDRRLIEVLSRPDVHKLSLNKVKCKFAVSEVDFYGYRLSASGVLPLGSNIKAILDLRQP